MKGRENIYFFHIFITVFSCRRVFSYPCLEVYLDKNEVSLCRNSLISMSLKYKELQFTTAINNYVSSESSKMSASVLETKMGQC